MQSVLESIGQALLLAASIVAVTLINSLPVVIPVALTMWLMS